MFDAIAGRRFVVGTRAGDAATFKVLNNQLAAVNLAAGAEALAIATHAGLDPRLFVDVVGASSGASWIFADRMPRALDGDYAPRAATTLLKKTSASRSILPPHWVATLRLPARRARRSTPQSHAGYGAEDDASLLKYYAGRVKKM